jgi:hypothetical protein
LFAQLFANALLIGAKYSELTTAAPTSLTKRQVKDYNGKK